MNDLCCGAPDGYCTRHGMKKNESLVRRCNGTSEGNCSALYWDAWERGLAGATVVQTQPQFAPPGFCSGERSGTVPCAGCGSGLKQPDFVQRAITGAEAMARFIGDGCQTASEVEQAERMELCETCPLNNAGWCTGCGCHLAAKTTMRLEGCPAGKWFPELHTVRQLVNPVRNLIYHILPVESNEIWKWNLQQLALRWHLFDRGKRCLSINYEDRNKVDGRLVATAQPDEVIEYCRSLGMEWTDIRAAANNRSGEVVGWAWLMERVQSTDPNTVTFYAHGKGVTRPGNKTVEKWTEWQYRACLDDWASTQRALERYSLAGAFRSFGEFKLPGNHQWHYSGTFFWFRHDDVFSRPDWQKTDQINFGVEAWPGRFKPTDSACLFSDDARDLYLETQWEKMDRTVQVYEAARL